MRIESSKSARSVAPGRLDHSAVFRAIVAAVWGSLVGSLSTGTRRTPARASTPVARLKRATGIPGRILPSSPVRDALPCSPSATRRQGTKLTVTARCRGPRAVTVDQPAGAP